MRYYFLQCRAESLFFFSLCIFAILCCYFFGILHTQKRILLVHCACNLYTFVSLFHGTFSCLFFQKEIKNNSLLFRPFVFFFDTTNERVQYSNAVHIWVPSVTSESPPPHFHSILYRQYIYRHTILILIKIMIFVVRQCVERRLKKTNKTSKKKNNTHVQLIVSFLCCCFKLRLSNFFVSLFRLFHSIFT